MAVLAVAYGIVVQHSVWYPINLLATGFLPGLAATTAALAAFHWDSLIIASLIHLITSLLVGLLYGAMLPMFPRHPILLGGVIAPVLWTGLIHGVIDYINPRAQPADRLALVRRLASRIRTGCGPGRFQPRIASHMAASSFPDARGHRSARGDA